METTLEKEVIFPFTELSSKQKSSNIIKIYKHPIYATILELFTATGRLLWEPAPRKKDSVYLTMEGINIYVQIFGDSGFQIYSDNKIPETLRFISKSWPTHAKPKDALLKAEVKSSPATAAWKPGWKTTKKSDLGIATYTKNMVENKPTSNYEILSNLGLQDLRLWQPGNLTQCSATHTRSGTKESSASLSSSSYGMWERSARLCFRLSLVFFNAQVMKCISTVIENNWISDILHVIISLSGNNICSR